MRRLAMLLLLAFSFAVPWEYSLDLGEPFGNITRVLGALLFLAVVPLVLRRGHLRRPGAMQWLVLALYLYFTCSYFWTIDAIETLEKIRAYFQVMMVVWIAWEMADSPDDLRNLLRAFVAGCWILAILTMIDYAAADAAAAQIRFAAAGQDPNDVARFLDLGFPFATLLFATESRWWLRLSALAYLPAGLLAILLTASRGGFSAAFAALVGSSVLLVVWRPRGASIVFLGMAVTLGALWLFVPPESLNRLATIPDQVAAGDLNDRFNLWRAGFHAFTLAPWCGYGAGTYATAAGLAAGDTAHNTLMAVLVTGGLAGTGIFFGIVVVASWAVFQTVGLLRIALAATLVIWFITSMVGSVEENRTTWLIFSMIALAGRLAAEYPQSLADAFAGAESSRPTAQPCAVRL